MLAQFIDLNAPEEAAFHGRKIGDGDEGVTYAIVREGKLYVRDHIFEGHLSAKKQCLNHVSLCPNE